MINKIKQRLKERSLNKRYIRFLEDMDYLYENGADLVPLAKSYAEKHGLEEPVSETVETIDEGNSTITFSFDSELSVNIETKINPEIAMVLLDNEYIDEEHVEDKLAVEIAFILMASEAVNQIISQYEDKQGLLENNEADNDED